MRAWVPAGLALLLLVPLSGCLQGDRGTSTPTFTPTCPNWTKADHPLAGLTDTQLHNTPTTADKTTRTTVETFPFSNGKAAATAPEDEGGKRADGYELHFPAAQSGAPLIWVENGTLEIRLYRNDTGEQLPITDAAHPGATQMAVTFPSGYLGGAQLLAYLVSPTKDPTPAALRFEAKFTALPGFVISSGAKGEPRVGAIYSVEPFVLYRAAGCVQK
jgi:hypothetical protein